MQTIDSLIKLDAILAECDAASDDDALRAIFSRFRMDPSMWTAAGATADPLSDDYHAGQMALYLAVADDQLRKPGDGPSIGLILCKTKNRTVADYVLRGITAPIGISEYQLADALPDALKGSLPTIAELEAELTALPNMEEENSE